METELLKTKRYRSTITPFTRVGEKDFGPSMTEPDMAMSMRELLKRHANGIADN